MAMEWPLIERELTRRARDRRTYGLRSAIGVIAFVALGIVAWTTSATGRSPEMIGAALMAICRSFQFAAAFLLPLMLSADLIAKEKRERTLGLLLLADSSSVGIYAAKFLSAFLPCSMLIMGALPVIAIAAPFGGMDIIEITKETLVYLSRAFAVTTIGLLASLLSRNAGPAFFLSLLFVSIWSALEGITSSLMNGTFAAVFMGSYPPVSIFTWFAGGFLADGTWYWDIASSPALGAALIGTGVLLLPRHVEDRLSSFSGLSLRRKPGRTRKLRILSPSEQLLNRGMSGWTTALRPLPIKVLASLSLILFWRLSFVGTVLAIVLITLDSVSAIRDGQERGVLDDIKLTTENPESVAHLIFRVLMWRGLFYIPVLICVGGFGAGMNVFFLLAGLANHPASVTSLASSFLYSLYGAGIVFALPFAQLALVVTLSMREVLGSTRSLHGSTARVVFKCVIALIFVGFLSLLFAGAIGLAIDNIPETSTYAPSNTTATTLTVTIAVWLGSYLIARRAQRQYRVLVRHATRWH